MSISKDKSHSWVSISHGLNKLVTNLNNNDQETSGVQFRRICVKIECGWFCKPIKGQSKTTKMRFCQLIHKNYTYWRRNLDRCWTRRTLNLRLWSVEELIHLLRQGNLPREDDGAIEFWRIKDNLQKHFLYCHHWSDDKWKKSMARGGGNKKRYQHCTDSSGAILYLWPLQGHSGRSLIDPILQDNVLILDDFFEYIYHVGCAFNLHSIISSGLILGGRNLGNRQTVFFLLVDPMDKNLKGPEKIDLGTPLHAQYMHKAWKKHQNTVYWVDINLAMKKGLKFYSNATILHETLPAYCVPKVVRMETGEVLYEKVYASLRPPPKISLTHDWMKELGSEVARQTDGEVVQQFKSSQSSQPNPNPDHDRTVKPVVCRDANHEQPMLNEVDIDFRIRGLPHSVAKQAENYRVRELVKKIENHPHRQSLQRDLQQNKAYNPFSTTSKKMIQDVGNAELFELFETDPKTQCKECLSYWSEGIVYCTCGHLLKEIAASRGVIHYTLDLLSIPNYVTKKGRPHGHRYGKTPQQKEYHQAHNLKKDASRSISKGSTIASCERTWISCIPWSNMIEMKKCVSKWDDLADKDFSHYMTESEYFRYKQNWWISLKKCGNTGPLRIRSDFNEALSTLNRLHQESGERPMPYWKYQERHPSSSSSSSWWQWNGSWWSL